MGNCLQVFYDFKQINSIKMWDDKESYIMSDLFTDIINTADSFTENFKDRNNFDYSIESLLAVNELLDEMCDYIVDEDILYNAYTMIGSYVFEVARKNYGGQYYWIREEEQPVLIAGEPEFSVSIKAWDKVRMYIENGSDENLQFYLDGYREHIEKGKINKGYKALIV